MCASKNIAMLMRVKYFYCDENMLLLVNLYVRILDITMMSQLGSIFHLLWHFSARLLGHKSRRLWFLASGESKMQYKHTLNVNRAYHKGYHKEAYSGHL